MCGIWGVVTKFSNGLLASQVDMVEDMIVSGSRRGRDSCGLFYAFQDGTPGYFKVAGTPFDLIDHPDFGQVRSKLLQKAKVVVGHNRAATRGSVTTDNAHPFQHGPITLVHNGTIHYGLTVPTGQTDSEQICKALATSKGIDIFGEISGAWAAIWHDSRDNKLRILLNGQRPLSMVRSKADELYFASELKMLEWLMDTRKIEIKEEIKLKNDVVYAIDVKTLEMEETPAPQKKYMYSHSSQTHGSYHHYSGYTGGGTDSPGEARKTYRVQQAPPGQKATFAIKEIIQANNGQWLHKGVTVEEEGVFFWHPEPQYDMVMSTWEAPIVQVHVHKASQEVWYLVRFQECAEYDTDSTWAWGPGEWEDFWSGAGEAHEVPTEKEQKQINEEIQEATDKLAEQVMEVVQQQEQARTGRPKSTILSLPAPANPNNEWVNMADNKAYTRGNIMAALVGNDYRCMSCKSSLDNESHTISSCYPILGSDRVQIRALMCPECYSRSNKSIFGPTASGIMQ